MDSPSLPAGFAFSQSSLQDYSDCPRRFQLRYIEQLKWPAVESEPVLENERRQQEGQLFHRMVQQHLIGLPATVVSRQSSVVGLPDPAIPPFGHGASLSRWWDNYLAYKFEMDGYARRAELTLTAPVGTCRLLAKYDLVAVRPGERALIYDWKTYQKRPRDERMAARLQTRVYRALLVQAGAYLNGGTALVPEQIEMIYWYADFPSEPACFPYKATQYKRDWDGLTSLINEIVNHRHFPLTEDEKKCAYCAYRSYCNRGEKAGSLDEMETELSEPEINLEQIAEIEF
jgi:hypothetical protein